MFRLDLLATAVLLCVLVGCSQSSPRSGGDSESHFLQSCDDQCDEGLSCICGVCTKGCQDLEPCLELADSASCGLLPASCNDAPGPRACQVQCERDRDCEGLGPQLSCRAGACRPRPPQPVDGGKPDAVAPSDAGARDAAPGPREAGQGEAGQGEPDSGPIQRDAEVDSQIPFDSGLYPECCLHEPITWQSTGGFAAPQTSSLSGCGTYVHEAEATCTNELPECDQEWTFDASTIQAAIEHGDVRAARAQAPILFGADNRPVDGVLLRVEINGDSIEVGDACAGQPDCREIPEGIAALVTMLKYVTLQQGQLGDCAPPDLCRLPGDTGPCFGIGIRYGFLAETGRCGSFTYGLCEGNDNNFMSLQECDQTCGQSPCSQGQPFDPEAPCNAETLAGNRCFADVRGACLCECAKTGNPVSRCEVLENVPAYATCD